MEIANWEVVELEDHTWHKYHITSGGEMIALMDDGAEAHLAAAAPMMYEALKFLVTGKREDGKYDRHDAAGFIKIAEEALAEAREK